MNRRKSHISPWASMLLAWLVAIGSIVLCVGTAYARYRTEQSWEQQFQARDKGIVLLGQMVDDVFSETESAWVSADGQLTLFFAAVSYTHLTLQTMAVV